MNNLLNTIGVGWILAFSLIGSQAALAKGSPVEQTKTTSGEPQSSETEMIRRMREQIMSEDSLSMAAKNIQIIPTGRTIILKGTAASTTEKAKLAELVANHAAGRAVQNEVEVR